MMPHSIPPSSPPGGQESADVDMEDGASEAQPHVSVPYGMRADGDGDGQNEDGDDGDYEIGEKKKSSKSNVNLEELFDAEDSDEEFSSSAVVRGANEAGEDERKEKEEGLSAPLPVAPAVKSSDPEVLRAYYQRLFPFRYLFQWLNHSPAPTNDFAHREFAFTLQNDAYLRYQSFPSADLLRKQCIQMTPSRFEIGPVYSTNPRDRKTLRRSTTAFRPIGKELVFDIDMTDYDDIRTCCQGAAICRRCWRFITMAIKVVDVALREDFGFRHVLWVYSGRRGVHAWVCDRRARALDDAKRKAIAGYLEVLKGGGGGGARRVNLRRPLHPHISRSLNILKQHFQSDILTDQDPWSDDSKASHLLDLLLSPSTSEGQNQNQNQSQTKIIKSLVTALRKKWDSSPGRSSANKWADIDALAATISQESNNSNNNDNSSSSSLLNAKDLLTTKQSILLEHTYPRLDAEVSKKQIHLLKSPFCIHPGTGRVCVPIDIGRYNSNSNSNSKSNGNSKNNSKSKSSVGNDDDAYIHTHDTGSPSSSTDMDMDTDTDTNTIIDMKLNAFDPMSVPTVGTLLAEIDAWDGDGGEAGAGAGARVRGGAGDRTRVKNEDDDNDDHDDDESPSGTNSNKERRKRAKMADYEKTSLKPYVDRFRRFVAELLRDEGVGIATGTGNSTGNATRKQRTRDRERERENAGIAGHAGRRGTGDPMEF